MWLQVFPAEKMVSQNNVYHKKCFSCRDCARPLDPFLACDTPDMEVSIFIFIFIWISNLPFQIACRNCYNKCYSVTSEWCNMSGLCVIYRVSHFTFDFTTKIVVFLEKLSHTLLSVLQKSLMKGQMSKCQWEILRIFWKQKINIST